MDEKDQTAQEAHRLGRTMRRNIRNVKSSHSDKVLLIAEDAVDKVTDLDQRQRVADMPADSQPVEVLNDITTEAHAEIALQDDASDITSAEAKAANSILTQAHDKTVREADEVADEVKE
jgi:delta-aminolevulinic acid dehydratase/porphobilinogen synthase